jgi:hypothetical protein
VIGSAIVSALDALDLKFPKADAASLSATLSGISELAS